MGVFSEELACRAEQAAARSQEAFENVRPDPMEAIRSNSAPEDRMIQKVLDEWLLVYSGQEGEVAIRRWEWFVRRTMETRSLRALFSDLGRYTQKLAERVRSGKALRLDGKIS